MRMRLINDGLNKLDLHGYAPVCVIHASRISITSTDDDNTVCTYYGTRVLAKHEVRHE